MPQKNTAALQAVVDGANPTGRKLIISVRPTTKKATVLLEQGASPKPVDVKAKSINKLDTYLGVAEEHIGKVGFFQPRPPTKPPGMSDAEWQKLLPKVSDRYLQRLGEFWDESSKISQLQKPVGEQQGTHGESQVQVGEDGVLLNALDPKQSPFTGDHDIFDIRFADNGAHPSEAQEAQIVALLKGSGVEHGALLSWVPKKPSEIRIMKVILNSHMDTNPGAEPLIEFRGGQAPRATYGKPQ